MRVLVIPEVYRLGDLTGNGTVNDAVAWVRQWLRRDPTLHVYWLLPPRDAAGYAPEDVLADRPHVTLIEAGSLMLDTDRPDVFAENGYTAEQLAALRTHIFERDAYVDVVVDQLRTGRFTLYKWLLEHSDQWAAAVRPFDVVANVHDLQLPYKYRWCSYRNAYQMRMELCGAAFADGIWFTAGVDAAEFRRYATEFLRPSVVDAALDAAVETRSPIAFERYEERYAAEPTTLHVAGSLWEKKNVDRVVEAAAALHDRFGIETVMTSVDEIPAAYRRHDWIDAYPNASRSVYEEALGRGDLAVCASEYETMARTPFEQAASGQVLILREGSWVHDCVPADYPFLGDLDDLGDLAVAAVDDWAAAVRANRRLVEHLREVRGPAHSGERTYADLRRRVDAKRAHYESGKCPEVVSRAVAELDAAEFAVDDLIERTSAFTDDGRPLTARESYAFVDLVYTLRALGYEDTGNSGTPVFRPR